MFNLADIIRVLVAPDVVAPSFDASTYSNNYRENTIQSRTFSIDWGNADTNDRDLDATSDSLYIESITISSNQVTVTLDLDNVTQDRTAIVNLTATNSVDSDTATWTISIDEAGGMWSQNSYSYNYIHNDGTKTINLASLFSGTPTATVSSVGTLPSGVSLSGTTLTIDTDIYNGGSFTLRTTNVNGSDDASFGIGIHTAPVIASISDTTRDVGSTYTTTATLSSGSSVTWSISGPGASITSGGSITVNVPSSVGTYNYEVTATNSAGSDTEGFSISAIARTSPTISSIGSVSRTPGYSSFTISVSVSGSEPITWSISGISGASISSSGTITIPSGLSIGTHSATVTASNSEGSDTEGFSVTVAVPALALASISDQVFVQGSGDQSVSLPQATGGSGGYTYTLYQGSLDITFAAINFSLVINTNAISQFSYTWSVTDSDGNSTSSSFTITKEGVPVASADFSTTVTQFPDPVVTRFTFSSYFTAYPAATYSWSLGGINPGSFQTGDSDDGTQVWARAYPAAPSGNSATLTITGTNSYGSDSITITIIVP